MTRDEAIKAMREGKLVKHPKDLCGWRWEIPPFGYGQPRSLGCELPEAWVRILDSDYDDGWELVKRKVKKTVWVGFYHYKGIKDLKVACYYTSDAFLDKEDNNIRDYGSDFIGIYPVEIEVEE